MYETSFHPCYPITGQFISVMLLLTKIEVYYLIMNLIRTDEDPTKKKSYLFLLATTARSKSHTRTLANKSPPKRGVKSCKLRYGPKNIARCHHPVYPPGIKSNLNSKITQISENSINRIPLQDYYRIYLLNDA